MNVSAKCASQSPRKKATALQLEEARGGTAGRPPRLRAAHALIHHENLRRIVLRRAKHVSAATI